MARPKKTTVDYFPHFCEHKTTMFILEQRYGNDGYAFWFKVLEMLASTEGHYIDCNNIHKWEFLQAKTHLNENTCIEILDLLASLAAIDPKLWSKKIIWSDNFIAGIVDVYRNRRVEIPPKPSFYRRKPRRARVSTDNNPQSKVKESKVNKYMFKKPTIKEVQQYCQERKNNIDPENFYNFYESKGWMIGKNKMKNWKAAIRTWERNDKQKTDKKIKPITVSQALSRIKREQTTNAMTEILQNLKENQISEFKEGLKTADLIGLFKKTHKKLKEKGLLNAAT